MESALPAAAEPGLPVAAAPARDPRSAAERTRSDLDPASVGPVPPAVGAASPAVGPVPPAVGPVRPVAEPGLPVVVPVVPVAEPALERGAAPEQGAAPERVPAEAWRTRSRSDPAWLPRVGRPVHHGPPVNQASLPLAVPQR